MLNLLLALYLVGAGWYVIDRVLRAEMRPRQDAEKATLANRQIWKR